MKEKAIKLSIAFLILVIVVLLYIVINNQKYTQRLSSNLMDDFSSIHAGIQRSREVYRDILKSGTITRNQIDTITSSNSNMGRLSKKYESLALKLGYINPKQLNDDYDINKITEQIQRYFYEISDMMMNSEGYDSPAIWRHETNKFTTYPLSALQLQQIQMIYELNEKWKQIFMDYLDDMFYPDQVSQRFHNWKRYYNRGIKMKFWARVLVDMSSRTEVFLESYGAENVSELLK